MLGVAHSQGTLWTGSIVAAASPYLVGLTVLVRVDYVGCNFYVMWHAARRSPSLTLPLHYQNSRFRLFRDQPENEEFGLRRITEHDLDFLPWALGKQFRLNLDHGDLFSCSQHPGILRPPPGFHPTRT